MATHFQISSCLPVWKASLFLVLTTALTCPCSASTSADRAESPGLIMREMIALDKAFKTTIDAIVFNDPKRIAPAFEDVHRVRAEIKEAVKRKTPIQLPKNQKRFKEFLRLDNKFHHELDLLIHAAQKNNMVKVRKQTRLLLDTCVHCHTTFRK